MDTKTPNITIGLVRAILKFTSEERNSFHSQSTCQYIYCKLSSNDQDDNNGTCYVIADKSSSFDDAQQSNNLFCTFIVKYISLYIYPLLILLGIFGNSLSCIIMFLNVRRNGYSANLYLALLAFIDCLFLLGSALPDWISHIDSQYDIKLFSDLFCRFVYWFGNFVTHLSVGLVVSVTVERFIAVQFPLFAHKVHNVKNTHIVLTILITFFFILDSPVFILVKHVQESMYVVSTCNNDTNITYERRDLLRCNIANEKNKEKWVFTDFAVYTLIPFLIIITLNSLIIRRLIEAQRFRQHMTQLNIKPTNHPRHNLYRNKSDSDSIVPKKQVWVRRCRSAPTKVLTSVMFSPQINQHRIRYSMKPSSTSIESSLETKIRSNDHYEQFVMRHRTNTNNMRLTILLLFVSCLFLLLTLPAVLINLVLSTTLKTPSNLKYYANLRHDNYISESLCYYKFARLLMILNHSINFILYFVVGKRFRRDLKNLFINHCKKAI